MRIFFSVGEPSGDLHGANLVKELKRRQPAIQCVGYGGPKMAAAGCELHEDLTKLAVMWFLRVLLNIHRFWSLYRRADRYLCDHRPDAVVLIDYPGFNWWIARSAKRHGIPVFYYGVPQMWAWAGWRVTKMRRLVDHVLCKLPFEEQWFRQRNCHATYVGHPYFDEVSQRQLDSEFVQTARGEGNLITILPGSRSQEVVNNLPWFLRSAARIRERVPQARFAIASFNQRQAAMARELIQQFAPKIPIEVFVGRTPELIEAAHCCLACSGSVSLELLYHQKPTVILYWINRIAYIAQGFIRQVPSITLVNLMAMEDPFSSANSASHDTTQMPFPEYVTCQDRSQEMSAHVLEWLTNASAYARRVDCIAELKREFCHPGASSAAAEYVLKALSDRPPQMEIRDAA